MSTRKKLKNYYPPVVNGAILTYSEEARYAEKVQIAQATQTDFSLEDRIPTYSEEAALKKAKEIAQKMIQKGWDSTEITETTGLDRETVESLMGAAQA